MMGTLNRHTRKRSFCKLAPGLDPLWEQKTGDKFTRAKGHDLGALSQRNGAHSVTGSKDQNLRGFALAL